MGSPRDRKVLRASAVLATLLTCFQILLGTSVRIWGAGSACPDLPLCLGRLIPPLTDGLVVLHFSHRLLGIVLLGSVLLAGHLAFWKGGSGRLKTLGLAMVGVGTVQLLVGYLAVYLRGAPVSVIAHTLLALLLLALTAWTAVLAQPQATGEGRSPPPRPPLPDF